MAQTMLVAVGKKRKDCTPEEIKADKEFNKERAKVERQIYKGLKELNEILKQINNLRRKLFSSDAYLKHRAKEDAFLLKDPQEALLPLSEAIKAATELLNEKLPDI